MWPMGHLAVGYLLYSTLVRLRGQTPRDYPVVFLVFGTQFPDLVDKPLAWSFDILPNGRSFAHSLFTALILLAGLHLLFRRYGHSSLSHAFGVGYLSHLAGDAIASATVGEYSYHMYGFLAWPFVPAIDEGEKSLLAQFPTGGLATLSAIEVGVAVLVASLWVLDGTPGLRVMFAAPRQIRQWIVADR